MSPNSTKPNARTRRYHDWPALTKRAAALITSGQVEPQFTALADALKIPRPTVDTAFRSLGITADILANPDRWPKVEARVVSKHNTVSDESGRLFQGLRAEDVITWLRKRPMTLPALANVLDRGTDTVQAAVKEMIAAGFGIQEESQLLSVPKYVQPQRAPVLSDAKSRYVKFAVASDWHTSSKACQISALRAFLDLAVKKHGCTAILVPGDLTAGQGVYRGQQNEVYAYGASDQKDALINAVPAYPGVTYYMLGGNHDYSHMKQSGYDIIRDSCQARPDWIYLGYDEAVVPLTEDLDIALWHPSGGVPYALTYRGQKYAAELAQRELYEVVSGKKERPRTRFIFWGHLHVAASFPHGPIRVIGPGCFEGKNSYLKQKGLTPKIQGVVVEAWLTDNNLIQHSVVHEYEYEEIEEDWRHAYIPSAVKAAAQRVTPMYTFKQNKGT